MGFEPLPEPWVGFIRGEAGLGTALTALLCGV